MTIEDIARNRGNNRQARNHRFKRIMAVYETLTVKEDITNYLKTGTRYTAPQQGYGIFKSLIIRRNIIRFTELNFCNLVQ
jgi:hypothetical protein